MTSTGHDLLLMIWMKLKMKMGEDFELLLFDYLKRPLDDFAALTYLKKHLLDYIILTTVDFYSLITLKINYNFR